LLDKLGPDQKTALDKALLLLLRSAMTRKPLLRAARPTRAASFDGASGGFEARRHAIVSGHLTPKGRGT
jgi:hypothetical protein